MKKVRLIASNRPKEGGDVPEQIEFVAFLFEQKMLLKQNNRMENDFVITQSITLQRKSSFQSMKNQFPQKRMNKPLFNVKMRKVT